MDGLRNARLDVIVADSCGPATSGRCDHCVEEASPGAVVKCKPRGQYERHAPCRVGRGARRRGPALRASGRRKNRRLRASAPPYLEPDDRWPGGPLTHKGRGPPTARPPTGPRPMMTRVVDRTISTSTGKKRPKSAPPRLSQPWHPQADVVQVPLATDPCHCARYGTVVCAASSIDSKDLSGPDNEKYSKWRQLKI